MSRNIASLLRRIVGRLKENMAALYMGMGSIFIPLSFYLKLEGGDSFPDWYFGGVLLLGIFFWILAIRQTNKEARDNANTIKTVIVEIMKFHNDMLIMLKDNKIRQERNEQTTKNKRD